MFVCMLWTVVVGCNLMSYNVSVLLCNVCVWGGCIYMSVHIHIDMVHECPCYLLAAVAIMKAMREREREREYRQTDRQQHMRA